MLGLERVEQILIVIEILVKENILILNLVI